MCFVVFSICLKSRVRTCFASGTGGAGSADTREDAAVIGGAAGAVQTARAAVLPHRDAGRGRRQV